MPGLGLVAPDPGSAASGRTVRRISNAAFAIQVALRTRTCCGLVLENITSVLWMPELYKKGIFPCNVMSA